MFPYRRFLLTPTLLRSCCLIGGLVLAAAGTPALPATTVSELENPPEPLNGNRVLQLEELWRIGGEDDEENLLGVVDMVLADDQDNIYLLDIQLTEVQVFDVRGEYLRSLGRSGEGPGEIRRAADLVFLPDQTVGLVQSFPGKIVKVDRQGMPAGELHPGGDDPSAGGFLALRRSVCRNGHLALSGARITRGDNSRTITNFIALFDPAGRKEVTFLEETSVREFRSAAFSEKDMFFPHRGGWALGPRGRLFVAPRRNEYRIEVFNPDGSLEMSFSRPYRSLKRTRQEKERAREMLLPFRRRNRRSLDIVVEPTERDILDMRAGTDGRLWVLPSRGIKDQPAGIHSTWDVFAADGTYTETVSIPCGGDGSHDTVFFAGQDLLVLVKEHAEAMQAFRGRSREDGETESDLEARPLEVVCFRIVS